MARLALLLCLGGRSLLEAYGSRRVYECVIPQDTVRIFLQSLKIKDWNMQCKLNAMLSWNIIGEFWIKDFIVKLWCDLLTFTAVASSPESSEEQIPHNTLLINMTVQSVHQIRRRPEWNPVAILSISQTTCNWRHSLIWYPPNLVKNSSFYFSWWRVK